jgi:hypothetical protein
MGTPKIYQHLLLQDPRKFTQIGIFGLKIYHLATLLTVVKISMARMQHTHALLRQLKKDCDRKKVHLNRRYCDSQRHPIWAPFSPLGRFSQILGHFSQMLGYFSQILDHFTQI